MENQTIDFPTIIVGAGQCGLAMAHELVQRGEDFLVLEAGPTPGNSWRSRWDSLELFTPAAHDALPGSKFPDKRGSYPTAGAVADYLETYAKAKGVPVRTSTTVTDVRASADGGFLVRTADTTFTARRVVIATGVHQRPKIPAIAAQISAETRQLHSSEYRNPAMVADGPVAVVGFGTSGAQIACELVVSHPVALYGNPTPHVPEALIRFAPALYWLLVHRFLTRSTPMGRKVAKEFFTRGAPLIRVSVNDVQAAGVQTAGRVESIHGGKLMTKDGTPIEASTIIWATGYRPDYSWIDGLQLDELGYPLHRRGISTQIPGLGFLGIPFLYGLTSGIIGGVGRDSRYLARHLHPYKEVGHAADTPFGLNTSARDHE
ncbi:MAG: NAD(P)/FAD-dependent oxidoreductase [Paeniglutamicibacter terrestris]